MEDEPPFEVVDPRVGESPVVVEIPHAGLRIDAESLGWTMAPARSIAADADLYVDALFQDAASEGATTLRARMSRYVVDLNRGERDFDAEAVEGGATTPWPRGLIWRLTTDGDPILPRRMTQAELTRRLDAFYRPYHATLRHILERKRARFGFAMLLCAHSMPSLGRRGHKDPGTNRADLVPGTRGRTSASGVFIDAVDRHGRERGWSVRHDDPYRGGFSTAHYGTPAQDVHAVQIEIARRLYMDELSFRPYGSGFQGVREFARTLVARLALLSPGTSQSARGPLPPPEDHLAAPRGEGAVSPDAAGASSEGIAGSRRG